jgi:ketosteroid isomerase-like protein
VQEILVAGDIASCWARLEVHAVPLDGSAPSVLRGDVLSVYRREADGAWRLARDANLLALAS